MVQELRKGYLQGDSQFSVEIYQFLLS